MRELTPFSLLGVETPAWQGARKANSRAQTDEQRRQAEWIGIQNAKVILARALKPNCGGRDPMDLHMACSKATNGSTADRQSTRTQE